MTVSEATASEMENTVASLRRELGNAYAQAMLTSFGDDAARLAAQGQLRDIGTRIDRLDGELREQVFAGTFEFSRWRAIAVIQHEAMVSLVGDIGGTEGFWNHLRAFVAETPSTVSEIIDDTKEVIAKATDLAPYALLGIGLVVLLYLTVQTVIVARAVRG
jgi:hypothetical protein